MGESGNTLFLRLSGPMQSWGTASRFQLRRTDLYPSKSGILGLLLCAMGIGRRESAAALPVLNRLRFGVRADHPGTAGWDYHTAGAGIGIRDAMGKIKEAKEVSKFTQKMRRYETLLSRRQYLYDASFLVALHGEEAAIADAARALEAPVWCIFLGRKCCVPSEPVFAGTGTHDSPEAALRSIPWRPRGKGEGRPGGTRTLEVFCERAPGGPPPADAILVHDSPRAFGFHDYGPRWVVRGTVEVPVAPAPMAGTGTDGAGRGVDYASSQWRSARGSRLLRDRHLCVFCKAPAVDVHHVSYAHAGRETDDDLRSLCKICHDACTMLEYSDGMGARRIDPADPALRVPILDQIRRLLAERRPGRRRELRERAGTVDPDFFESATVRAFGEGC